VARVPPASPVLRVATMNLNPVVRKVRYQLIVTLVRAILFTYIIVKVLLHASSLDQAKTERLISDVLSALRVSLDQAVRLLERLEKMKIPRAVYNAAAGSIMSASGNVMSFKRPSLTRAAVFGGATAVYGSYFPSVSLLSQLKGIQKTTTKYEGSMRFFLSRAGNVARTTLGFQSKAQQYSQLNATIVRYTVKLALALGLHLSKDLFKIVKFMRSSDANKRFSLLTRQERNVIARRVMNIASESIS